MPFSEAPQPATGKLSADSALPIFNGTLPELFPSRNVNGRHSFRQIIQKAFAQTHQRTSEPESGPLCWLGFIVATKWSTHKEVCGHSYFVVICFTRKFLTVQRPDICPGNIRGLWALGLELSLPRPVSLSLHPHEWDVSNVIWPYFLSCPTGCCLLKGQTPACSVNHRTCPSPRKEQLCAGCVVCARCYGWGSATPAHRNHVPWVQPGLWVYPSVCTKKLQPAHAGVKKIVWNPLIQLLDTWAWCLPSVHKPHSLLGQPSAVPSAYSVPGSVGAGRGRRSSERWENGVRAHRLREKPPIWMRGAFKCWGAFKMVSHPPPGAHRHETFRRTQEGRIWPLQVSTLTAARLNLSAFTWRRCDLGQIKAVLWEEWS